MSIQIIETIPQDYKLYVNFDKNCRLYKKNDLSFVCGVIVPWYDNKEKYLLLTLEENTITERLTPPIGYTTDEYSLFSENVLISCENILEHIFSEGSTLHDFYTKFLIEYLSQTFIANTILVYLGIKRDIVWNDNNKLLYCIAQMLHTSYLIVFDRNLEKYKLMNQDKHDELPHLEDD